LIMNNSGKLKLYRYYFRNADKPITMEAYSFNQANAMMNELALKSNGKVDLNEINNFTVEVPLRGVSKKIYKGIEWVWVGLDKAEKGWMPTSEFNKL